MDLTRRRILFAAPAVILTPGLLMPVRSLVRPAAGVITLDLLLYTTRQLKANHTQGGATLRIYTGRGEVLSELALPDGWERVRPTPPATDPTITFRRWVPAGNGGARPVDTLITLRPPKGMR